MGLFSPSKPATKAAQERAKREVVAARKQLEAANRAAKKAKAKGETRAYLNANDRVYRAEKAAKKTGVSGFWLWNQVGK